jgi:hypothetical protein
MLFSSSNTDHFALPCADVEKSGGSDTTPNETLRGQYGVPNGGNSGTMTDYNSDYQDSQASSASGFSAFANREFQDALAPEAGTNMTGPPRKSALATSSCSRLSSCSLPQIAVIPEGDEAC